MPEIMIRRANVSDAKGVSEILLEIGWFDDINKRTIGEVEKFVGNQIKEGLESGRHHLYVAQDRSCRAIGYLNIHWLNTLFLNGGEGYVSELFVIDEYRGKGVGELLLNEAGKMAKQNGCSRLMLLNHRDRESYRRKFYSKKGWTEREEVANFVINL